LETAVKVVIQAKIAPTVRTLYFLVLLQQAVDEAVAVHSVDQETVGTVEVVEVPQVRVELLELEVKAIMEEIKLAQVAEEEVELAQSVEMHQSTLEVMVVLVLAPIQVWFKLAQLVTMWVEHITFAEVVEVMDLQAQEVEEMAVAGLAQLLAQPILAVEVEVKERV
jgi:hypothetical protein